MSILGVYLTKHDLQLHKYNYNPHRDKGDAKYRGLLDRLKVDKDEEYEVLDFIQSLINKHNLPVSYVHKIEDALHSSDLKSIVFRDDLIGRIEKKLGL